MTKSQLRFEKFIVYFTLGYTALFTVISLVGLNVEFIYYTVVMGVSMSTILAIHKRIKFYPVVLMSLSALGLFHLMGGNLYLGDVRLYDFYFIDGVFKYDNFMHSVGSAIMVMVSYALLQPAIADEFYDRRIYFGIILSLVGMGLGTINEIIEFIGVLLFDIQQQVGGYDNTLLDLIYNMVGSIVMATILVRSNMPLVEVKEYTE